MTDRPAVTVIGLGTMGSRMAVRLLGGGFPVTVFNRSREKAAPLVAAGARVADSPRDAVQGAAVVMAMVADDRASREVWLGEQGALAGVAPGTILVESSTLSVGWVRDLGAAAAAAGCDFVDAPVTGSRNQAGAGELNFLVGGSADVLERVRPVLTVMARSITHLGPTGSGALVKLINNFVCGTHIASLAEALAMVERSALDRDRTMAVLVGGAMGSPIVKTIAERMLAEDFTTNFALKLLAKDLGYAIQEGRALDVPLTTARTALDVMERAIRDGHGDADMASAILPFRSHREN
jgi:3-hydroxyisobutyrate dehydrogenase